MSNGKTAEQETKEALERQAAEELKNQSTAVIPAEEKTVQYPQAGQMETYRQAIQIANQILKYAFHQKIGKALRFGKTVYLDANMVFSIAKNVPTLKWGLDKDQKSGMAFWKEYDDDGVLTFYAQAWAEFNMAGVRAEGIVGSASTDDPFFKKLLDKKPDLKHRVWQNLIAKAQTQAQRRAIVRVLGLAGIDEAKLKALGLVIPSENSVSYD